MYSVTPDSIFSSYTISILKGKNLGGSGGGGGGTGPTGPTGVDGSAVNTGAKGATGSIGPTGLQGPTGIAGSSTNTGAKGDTGANGPTGQQGVTGPVGQKGDTGAIGNTGANGPTGQQGVTGPAGQKGDTGAIGNTGANGPTGQQGQQGVTGPAGFASNTGATGADGPTGQQGEQGATGPAGFASNTGATGEAGPTGQQGATGPAGFASNTGATGANGPTGQQGDTGATGADGPTGQQGDTGPTGSDGPTGQQGDTGPAGNLPNGINYGDYLFWDPTSGTYLVGDANVVLGGHAGEFGQESNTVAIGSYAGQNTQYSNAIAIGNNAGLNTQGGYGISIGAAAGQESQGQNSIAIGVYAGNSFQGTNAIAIGAYAGISNQAANSIILNATGYTLNADTSSALYIAPVRADITQVKVLGYDTTTNEVTYFDTPTGGGGSLPPGTNYGDYLFWDSNTSTYAVGDANVVLGGNAGAISQQANAVAVGYNAGNNNQGTESVAMGIASGYDYQGQNSVSVGSYAGEYSQLENSVAIGPSAATDSGGFIGGEWLQYKLPNSIVLKYYQLATFIYVSDPDYNAENPYEWYLLASNDGSKWVTIDYQTEQDYTKWANVNVDYPPQYYNTYAVQNTKAYQYYRLAVTRRDPSVNTYNYYGIGFFAFNLIEDGATLTGDVGHEFVASGNFYPNVLLTSGDDQGYVTTQSSNYTDPLYLLSAQYQSQSLGSIVDTSIYTNDLYYPSLYNPFNGSFTPANSYVSESGGNSISIGKSAGQNGQSSQSISIGNNAGHISPSGAAQGEWIQYKLPSAIVLKYYQLACNWIDYDVVTNYYDVENPYEWYLLASNDGNTWAIIDFQTEQDYTKWTPASGLAEQYNTYTIQNNTASYQYYRLVITRTDPVQSYPYVDISGFNLIEGGTLTSQDGHGFLDPMSGGTAFPTLLLLSANESGYETSQSPGFINYYSDSDPAANGSYLLSAQYASQTFGSLVYVYMDTANIYGGMPHGTYNPLSQGFGYMTTIYGIGTLVGNSVAIGTNAGKGGQKEYAIAIGANAGTFNQPANTIILNASGVALNNDTADPALYISPIRGDVTQTKVLGYNTTTKEVTYFEGGSTLPSGTNYGDYLYWNGSTYAVGDANVVMGGHAGETNQGPGSIAIGYEAGTNNQTLGLPSTIAGEWFQYVPASPITPTYFQISFSNQYNFANDFSIVASNDESTWTQIGQQLNVQPSSIVPAGSGYNTYPVFASIPYQYFRVIFTHNDPVSSPGIQVVAFNLIVGGTIDINGLSVGGTAYPGITVPGGAWSQTSGFSIGSASDLSGSGQDIPTKSSGGIICNSDSYYEPGTGNYVGSETTSAGVNLGNSIAIGYQAAQNSQGYQSIAIGFSAGQDVQNINAIAIGVSAGSSNQGTNAIAIGQDAGANNQGTNSIAIGQYAGQTDQAANSIVINATGTYLSAAVASALYVAPVRVFTQQNVLGYDVATKEVTYFDKELILPGGSNYGDYLYWNGSSYSVGDSNVVIGGNAGQYSQGSGAVAIGRGAGTTNQGGFSVAIGRNAANSGQHEYSVAVGYSAGEINQGTFGIAIGSQAAEFFQNSNAIAIGQTSGQTSQGDSAIAIGVAAGNITQGTNAIAIGQTAGQASQGESAIAIGIAAGNNIQGTNAIAIGQRAGFTGQYSGAISIGYNSGYFIQGTNSVAIGNYAGETSQSSESVAIGFQAGQIGQSVETVAIGGYAGNTGQNADAIAIGYQAGQNNQGGYSIAIGALAGQNNQGFGTIIINAMGTALNGSIGITQALYIDPIRQQSNSEVLGYDVSTKEVTRFSGNFLPEASLYGQYSIYNGTSWVVTGDQSVSLGRSAGQNNQEPFATSIGYLAGQNTQGGYSVAVGASSGSLVQGTGSIAIGVNAGQFTQGTEAIAIGVSAGSGLTVGQASRSIAIGYQAGRESQQYSSIAIGSLAGNSFQGTAAVAIGSNAGESTQGFYAVAVGNSAGNNAQGTGSIAIGYSAGNGVASATQVLNQNSVAIGYQAGNQYYNSVAIGYQAGRVNQGTNAIAIGYQAGENNQGSNSIVLNASGVSLNGSSDSFYVNPIRETPGGGAFGTNLLAYNPGTFEVTYYSAKTFVIQHPDEADQYLVHACLEGPEAGVYYRGEGVISEGEKKVSITLPTYVKNLATDLTVHLTPVLNDDDIEDEAPLNLRSTRVRDNSFNVYANKAVAFHWVVFGKRGDVKAEVNKSDAVMRGDGPYKWLDTR